MIKAFALLRRRKSADFYVFRDYLRTELVADILAADRGRGIARIVTNHVLEHDFRPTTNADGHRWDAIVEIYFDDEAAALDIIRDPAFVAAHFARPDLVVEISHTLVEERVVIDHGPLLNAPKIFGFFKNSLPLGNPMGREEMGRCWNEHVGRMAAKSYDKMLVKFSQNRTLIDYHSVNPRYDYDGASIIWCESIEIGEVVYKNYDAEQSYISSSAAMGGAPGDCVYVRTDFIESYCR